MHLAWPMTVNAKKVDFAWLTARLGADRVLLAMKRMCFVVRGECLEVWIKSMCQCHARCHVQAMEMLLHVAMKEKGCSVRMS